MPFEVLAAQTGGPWSIRRHSTSTHHQPANCMESTVKKIFGTSSLASARAFVLQSAPGAGSTFLTRGKLNFVNETVCVWTLREEGGPPGESVWNKSEQATPSWRFIHPYATGKAVTNIWKLKGLSRVLVFIGYNSKVGPLSPPHTEGWLCVQPVSLSLLAPGFITSSF